MSDGTGRALATEYAIMGAYYRTALSDDVIRMYCTDLADLPEAECLRAMRLLRREPRRTRVPMPAEVRDALSADHDQSAELIAISIAAAVARIGYTQPQLAEAKLGPVGWSVVGAMGGWGHLCRELQAVQVGTFQAQAREAARCVIRRQLMEQNVACLPVPSRLAALPPVR